MARSGKPYKADIKIRTGLNKHGYWCRAQRGYKGQIYQASGHTDEVDAITSACALLLTEEREEARNGSR